MTSKIQAANGSHPINEVETARDAQFRETYGLKWEAATAEVRRLPAIRRTLSADFCVSTVAMVYTPEFGPFEFALEYDTCVFYKLSQAEMNRAQAQVNLWEQGSGESESVGRTPSENEARTIHEMWVERLIGTALSIEVPGPWKWDDPLPRVTFPGGVDLRRIAAEIGGDF